MMSDERVSGDALRDFIDGSEFQAGYGERVSLRMAEMLDEPDHGYRSTDEAWMDAALEIAESAYIAEEIVWNPAGTWLVLAPAQHFDDERPDGLEWFERPWHCGHADPIYIDDLTQECNVCGARRGVVQ